MPNESADLKGNPSEELTLPEKVFVREAVLAIRKELIEKPEQPVNRAYVEGFLSAWRPSSKLRSHESVINAVCDGVKRMFGERWKN